MSDYELTKAVRLLQQNNFEGVSPDVLYAFVQAVGDKLFMDEIGNRLIEEWTPLHTKNFDDNDWRQRIWDTIYRNRGNSPLFATDRYNALSAFADKFMKKLDKAASNE